MCRARWETDKNTIKLQALSCACYFNMEDTLRTGGQWMKIYTSFQAVCFLKLEGKTKTIITSSESYEYLLRNLFSFGKKKEKDDMGT